MKKFCFSLRRVLSLLLVVSMMVTSAGVTTLASAPTNYRNNNSAPTQAPKKTVKETEPEKEAEVETESQSEGVKSGDVEILGEKPEEEVTPEEETSNDAYVAELPGEYQELEFIESKNNAHIDTGVAGNSGVTTEMEVNLITSSSPAYVYGSRGDSGATRFLLARLSSKFDFAVKDDIKSSDWKLNTWYKLNLETTKNGTKLEVKDETGKLLNTKTTSNTYATNKSIWLFGTNTKSGNWSQAKMKQVKISEDGVLVRHFVPSYRKEDKVVGMYDLVNGAFYTNANSKNSSATFVAGPEVAKEEDSEEGEEDVPEEIDEEETSNSAPDFGPLAENESLAATNSGELGEDNNESSSVDKDSEVEEVVPNVEEATKSETVIEDTKETYIKDIKMAVESSKEAAINELTEAGYKVIEKNLNEGTSGKYIYLGYTVTTDVEEAITSIGERWFNASGRNEAEYTGSKLQYEYVAVTDLEGKQWNTNEGANNGSRWVYLYTSKDANAGQPIKSIEILTESQAKTIDQLKEEKYEVAVNSNNGELADFNRGNSGKKVYIRFERGEVVADEGYQIDSKLNFKVNNDDMIQLKETRKQLYQAKGKIDQNDAQGRYVVDDSIEKEVFDKVEELLWKGLYDQNVSENEAKVYIPTSFKIGSKVSQLSDDFGDGKVSDLFKYVWGYDETLTSKSDNIDNVYSLRYAYVSELKSVVSTNANYKLSKFRANGMRVYWKVASSGNIDAYDYEYKKNYDENNFLELKGDLFLVPVKNERKRKEAEKVPNIEYYVKNQIRRSYSMGPIIGINTTVYDGDDINKPKIYYINNDIEQRLVSEKEDIFKEKFYTDEVTDYDYQVYDIVFKNSYQIDGETFYLDVNSTNLVKYSAPSSYQDIVYDNTNGEIDEKYSFYAIKREDYIDKVTLPTLNNGCIVKWGINQYQPDTYTNKIIELNDVEELKNISNRVYMVPIQIENYNHYKYLETMFDDLKTSRANDYEEAYRKGKVELYGTDNNGKNIYKVSAKIEEDYKEKIENVVGDRGKSKFFAMFYNKYFKYNNTVYEVKHPDGIVVWEPYGHTNENDFRYVYEAVKLTEDSVVDLPSVLNLDTKKYILSWRVDDKYTELDNKLAASKFKRDIMLKPIVEEVPYGGRTLSISDDDFSEIKMELSSYMQTEYVGIQGMSEDIEKKHIEKLNNYFKDGDFEGYRIFYRPALKYVNSSGETKYKLLKDISSAEWMNSDDKKSIYFSSKMSNTSDAYQVYHGQTNSMIRWVGEETSLFNSFISDKEVYDVVWYTSEDFSDASKVTNATLSTIKKDVYLYPKVTFKEVLTSIPTYIKDELLTSSVANYKSAKNNLKSITFSAYAIDIDIDENATTNSDAFKKAMDSCVETGYVASYDIAVGVMGYIYGSTNGFRLVVAMDSNHYKTYILNDAANCFTGFETLHTISGLNLLDWSTFSEFNGLFSELPKLKTLDLSKINITSVNSINNMFKGDESLTSVKLPLALNTKDIDDMSYMFSGCKSLTTIDNLDKITLESATHLKDMFAGCPSGLTSTDGIKRFLNHNVTTTYTTDLFNALSVDNNVKKIVFETGKDRVSGSTKLKPGVFGYIKDNIVYVNIDYNVTLKMSGDVKSQLDNLAKYELEGFDKVDVKSVTSKVNISYELGKGASWKKGYTAPKTINFNAELKLDANNIVFGTDKTYHLLGFKLLAIDSNNKTLKDFGYVTSVPAGYPYLNYKVLADVQEALVLSQDLLYKNLGINRNEITSIKFALESNTKPAGTEKVLSSNLLTAYVNGKDVTYVVTNKLPAQLPKNCNYLFGGLSKVKTITGLNIFDGTNVESLLDIFANNFEMESIDLTGLKIPNVKNMRGMFWKNYKIKSIDFGGGINTSNVVEGKGKGFSYMFTNCKELEKIRNIKFLDSVNNYGYGSGPEEFAKYATKLDDESFEIVRELLPPLVIKAKSRLLYYDDAGLSYRTPYDVDTFRVITYDEFKKFYVDFESMKIFNQTQATLDRHGFYYDSNIGQNKNDIILFAVHLFNKNSSVYRNFNCEKNTRYLVYKKVKNYTLQNLKMNQNSTSLFEKVGNAVNPINFYGLDKISANGVKVADNMFKGLHHTTGINDIDKLKFTTLESANSMFDGCDKLLGVTLNINKDTFIDAKYMFRNCRSLMKQLLKGVFTQKLNPSLNSTGMFYGVTSLSEDDLEYDFDAAPIVKNEKPVTTLIDRKHFYEYINNYDNIEKIVIKGVDNAKKQYRKADFIKELTASAKFDNDKYVTLGSVVDGVVAYMSSDGKTYYIVYDKKHYIPQLPEDSSKYFSEPKKFKNLKAIEGLENFDYSVIKNVKSMFADLTSIEEIDLSNANFESMVHYIDGMFKSCENVKRIALPIKWDTALCQSSERMFYRCLNLENLENLDKMNLDWTENYSYMFAECAKLKEVQVSHFNMTEIPKYQVDNPYRYNGDRWFIYKETWEPKIDYMFYGMTNLRYLDLTGWYSSYYGIGDYVFAKCPNLQRIYVKVRKDGANRKYRQEAMFTIMSGKDNSHIFEGCDKLTTDFGAKVLDEEYTETISNAVKCSDNNCKEQHYYWDPAKGDTWYEDPWHSIIYNLHDGFVIRDNPRNKVYPFRYHIHKKIGQYDTIYCRPDLGPSFIIDLSTEYKNTWAYGQTKAVGSYMHRGIFTLLEDGKTIPREDLLKGSAKPNSKEYAKRMINAKQIASEYPYAGIDADCELLINVLYHLDNNETYYETLSFGDKFKTDMDTEDKEFLGWYLTADFSGEKVESITEDILDTNIDLFAKYKNKYKIEVHDGYTHTVNKSLKQDDKTYELPTPSRDGYVFLGWYLDSGYKNRITEISEVAKLDTNNDYVVDIYASWAVKEFTIKYNNIEDINITNANQVYVFDGEYVREKDFFNVLGESALKGRYVGLRSLAKDGYDFKGWYYDKDFTKPLPISKDFDINDILGYKSEYCLPALQKEKVVNIYAKLEETVCSITYDLVYSDVKFRSGYTPKATRRWFDKVELPLESDLTYDKNKYVFTGWTWRSKYKDGREFNYDNTGAINGRLNHVYDVTVKANFNVAYTITYNLSGGKWESGYTPVTKFSNKQEVIIPATGKLIRNGYVLVGWKDKDDNSFGKTTDFRLNIMVPKGANKNKEFTAVWRELYKYEMKYDLNGGSWAKGYKPQTIVTEGETITLPDSSKLTHKDGLAFDGWSVPDSSNILTTYTARGTEQKVVAKWRAGKYISEIKMSVDTDNKKAQDALTSNGYTLEKVNLNYGTKGKYIYIGYKTTNNANDAIRGIGERWFNGDGRNPSTYKGSYHQYNYTAVTDLSGKQHSTNEGANDGSKWVYLYTTKDTNAGSPITHIDVIGNSIELPMYVLTQNDKFKMVVNSNDNGLADFNRGNKGWKMNIRYR